MGIRVHMIIRQRSPMHAFKKLEDQGRHWHNSIGVQRPENQRSKLHNPSETEALRILGLKVKMLSLEAGGPGLLMFRWERLDALAAEKRSNSSSFCVFVCSLQIPGGFDAAYRH